MSTHLTFVLENLSCQHSLATEPQKLSIVLDGFEDGRGQKIRPTVPVTAIVKNQIEFLGSKFQGKD